jgi:small conductance mechanosensitive channel
MQLEGMIMNILIVSAEVLLLILIFSLLNLIIGRFFRRFMKLSVLQKREERADILRKNIKGALILLCIALCILVAGVNGLLVYQGKDLLIETRAWFDRIPPDFWGSMAIGMGEVILFVVAATIAIRYLHRLLIYAQDRAKAYEQIKANDESIESFFQSFDNIITNSIWLLVLVFSTMVLLFPEVVPTYLTILLKIYLIIALGRLLAKGIDAVIDSLDALSIKYSSPENLLRFYDRLREMIPLLKRSLEYIIYVYVATLAVLQVEFISQLAEYGPRIVRIIGIIFLSRVVIEIVNLIIEEFLLKSRDLSSIQKKRRLTIVPLVRSVLKYFIYFGAGIMVLIELGINPTPILAGAGIVGLAVGLGAQSLVNDVVSGFFILFENYYLVGDFIETGEARGTVEAIDIRTTRIRNPNGPQHILRNGQIGEIINYSKEHTRAVVEVGVAYESDLDHVFRVLEQVGKEIKEKYSDVLEPTVVRGLQNFGESELLIRTITKVKPGQHRQVQRDLRKMVKEAFDREGIEIPYARRVLILKDEEGVDRIASILERPAQ